MKKIISLFQRNYEGDRLVRNEVTPGAEWVLAGEGYATRKFDGTACMIKDGKLYKRFDAKPPRSTPVGFIPSQDPDMVTLHWPGWVPVGKGPEDKWHREAFEVYAVMPENFPDGTYELCGPKVQGNPEGFEKHALVPHGEEPIAYCPRDFEGLKEFFKNIRIEGIVWHHPDGRMVKIRVKDFGFKRI